MKVSIGMEKDITIIFIGFIKYERIGVVSRFELFKYQIYAKVGDTRGFFNGKWVI